MTVKKYPCPRCGQPMFHSNNPRYNKGKGRWVCKKKVAGEIIHCYATIYPDRGVRGPGYKRSTIPCPQPGCTGKLSRNSSRGNKNWTCRVCRRSTKDPAKVGDSRYSHPGGAGPPRTRQPKDCPVCHGLMTGKGTNGWYCKKCLVASRDPDRQLRRPGGHLRGPAPTFTRTKGKTEIFVVTCAQNATPRHKGFYAALEQYCNHRSAQLLVIPVRYRNPTSQWTDAQSGAEVWDIPKAHLINTRLKLGKNIEVIADVKTQPTAISPLTGFEAITAGESGILGHTKLQLRTVAAPQGRLPKILTTTGACTVPNYTDSKAGKLGEFHHTLGAVVVEVRGSIFHIRQINAEKDGCFFELENYYGPARWVKADDRPLSLTQGDTHVRAVDPMVERATEEIVKTLRPLNRVWHDLCDGYSFNHHSEKNPFVPIERTAIGAASVRQEVYDALEYVHAHTPSDVTSIIVPSNHNDFLQRWLHENDWRRLDPVNRLFYLETALVLARQANAGSGYAAEGLNAFIYWAKERFASTKNVRVLDYDESCMLGEIEHGLHGHQGPDGARGNLRNLRRIGVKTNTGHAHSPGIDEGAYRAGTSTRLRLGYNSGPSSWLNSHILTYANSKRTLINIINGEWRL